MTVVNSVVTYPDGRPVSGAIVTVSLVSSGTLPGFTTGETVVGLARIVTRTDGAWSVDLTPNADINPADTHYRVTEKVGPSMRAEYAIIVPAGGGPYTATELLATAPDSPAGLTVSTARRVIAGTGLTGGGDLSADRTLAVVYGTTAGTAAEGNHTHSPQIQSYTTPGSYTWNKPAGAKLVEVIVFGGGGSGGSGRRGAALTVRTGGGGGGGGGMTRALLNAADLPAACPIIVGTGALGGSSAAVTDNSNGQSGGSGGHTVFNDTVQQASSALRVRAGGGAPGAGGSTGQASGGGGGFALFAGPSGGNSNATGLVGTNGGDGSGGAGGGAGGGITAADAPSAGATGGVNSTLDQARAAAGVVGGAAAEPGRSTLSMGPGNGGGGGAASIAGPAGAGGQGGAYGGGGGGGGASLNGNAVGAGGRGGDGAAFVITYF